MNSDKSVTQRTLYSGDRDPDSPAPAELPESDGIAILLPSEMAAIARPLPEWTAMNQRRP